MFNADLMGMNISLSYLNINANLIGIYPIIHIFKANQTVVLNVENPLRPLGFRLFCCDRFT
jgi:hypothetical protein